MNEPTATTAAIEAVPGITKRCTECGEVKPLDQFSRHRSACRSCRAERARQRYQQNPERARESSRQWRRRNPEAAHEATRQWRVANPGIWEEAHARRRERDRQAVFDHYGWPCACCGATDNPTIDHVNGDGKQHRAEVRIRPGTHTYRWLVANGFPEGFQTLCKPCNRSKGDGQSCRLDHAAGRAA